MIVSCKSLDYYMVLYHQWTLGHPWLIYNAHQPFRTSKRPNFVTWGSGGKNHLTFYHFHFFFLLTVRLVIQSIYLLEGQCELTVSYIPIVFLSLMWISFLSSLALELIWLLYFLILLFQVQMFFFSVYHLWKYKELHSFLCFGFLSSIFLIFLFSTLFFGLPFTTIQAITFFTSSFFLYLYPAVDIRLIFRLRQRILT